ncbi:condensation domain-containing protein, partial [Mycolicibacterium sp. XJ2546]
LLADHARRPDVLQLAEPWKKVAATPTVLPATQPEADTYVTAGRFSAELDAEATGMLLDEVPAAFRAGTQDILLIAFAMAIAELLAAGGAPIAIDVEGHGRDEDVAGPDTGVDLSRTVGWFTAKYPVALVTDRLSWDQVIAGDAALGSALKNAKEQLRSLPDGLTYGLLRYLSPESGLDAEDPTIGFNYLGRLGAPTGDGFAEPWRVSPNGLSLT